MIPRRSVLFTVLPTLLLFAGAARAQQESAPNAPTRPRLDVAFILDTTGSMGDEIDVVKEKLVEIARRLSSGQPQPDVRFAVVAYRDKGDEYVTKTFAFNRDIRKVRHYIMGLSAEGGGDEPEDVAAALHTALRLEWDTAPSVARVAFLVGDAGPHAYPGEPTWQHAITNFKERGIEVETIGCSGLSETARRIFESIAERTGGKFEQLTYRRVVVAADGHKTTVLSAAGDTYVIDGEVADKDWKVGAEELVKAGKAKKVSASAAPTFLSAGAAATTNNLDAEISTRLVEKAEAAGARYAR